jgi:hypothetical protein
MTKQTSKKPAKKSHKNTSSDFAPTKVGLAVAALASVSLVVFALLATLS